MSAVRRCRHCSADIVERLIAGHLVWRHLVDPKSWHKPEPR